MLANVRYIWHTVLVTSQDLRGFLREVGLSQADLAGLLDVTPRAVTFWLTAERTIPGPVQAYARLFQALTPASRHVERSRLKERPNRMREGLYAVSYQNEAATNYGYATVILENGSIHGADVLGSMYDGDYAYNEAVARAEVHLKVTFPANVAAVFAPAQPFEWSVDMSTYMDPQLERGFLELTTTLGQKIRAQYQFLRGLPNVAL
jgi:hypothetical protein